MPNHDVSFFGNLKYLHTLQLGVYDSWCYRLPEALGNGFMLDFFDLNLNG